AFEFQLFMNGASGLPKTSHFIHQAIFFGLVAIEDLPLGQLVDVFFESVFSDGRDVCHELLMCAREQIIQQCTLFISHWATRVTDVFVSTGLDGFLLVLGPLEKFREIRHLHDHPDGTSESASVSIDSSGGSSNVVTTTGGHGTETGVDWLGLINTPNLFIDLLCRGHCSPWRINAKNDGLNVFGL